MNYRFLLLFGLIIVLVCSKLQAQAIPNLGQTDRWMKGALAAMERNEFETANSIFRNLIDSGLPLPEEMPYYFAETLFQLKQYDNSQNFLNKYLELSGFRGENYQSAQELKKKLAQPIAEIKACDLCTIQGYRYETCENCMGKQKIEQSCSYCRAVGVVGCSRCVGSGMITKRNIFNIVEYFECERCNGKGRLTCPTCEGTKVETSNCRVCDGSGKTPTEVVCDHKATEHQHEEEKL